MRGSNLHCGFSVSKQDLDLKIILNKCDMCNDRIDCMDNIETSVIDRLDELNDSYPDERDRSTYYIGPMLLLCSYCIKEYGIPSYPFT
jgi:hypothetical protein